MKTGPSLRTLAGLTLLSSLTVIAPRAAEAQGLRPPTTAQVNAAKTMFKRGLVALIDQNDRGGLEQITLFGSIDAPQQTVFDVIADPNTLPEQQPGMRNVKIRAKRGSSTTYSWTYGDVLTKINGVWSAATAPPHAVSVRSMSGFGPGFILFRLFPDGPDRTILTTSMNIDATKSTNAIFRWLTNASPDFRLGWNLGYAVVLHRGIELVAVKRAGTGTLPAPTGKAGAGPLRPFGPAHAKRLMPLLEKGGVAVIESDAQGRIAQASIAELVDAPPSKIQAALEAPERWPRFIKVLDIDNVQKTASGATFDMEFGFVAFNVHTHMESKVRPDGADMSSPSGSLKRSLFSFTHAPHGGGSILTSNGRIRLRQGGRILRRMVDNDPYFGHAMNAGSMFVISHSFKTHAEGRR